MPAYSGVAVVQRPNLPLPDLFGLPVSLEVTRRQAPRNIPLPRPRSAAACCVACVGAMRLLRVFGGK